MARYTIAMAVDVDDATGARRFGATVVDENLEPTGDFFSADEYGDEIYGAAQARADVLNAEGMG